MSLLIRAAVCAGLILGAAALPAPAGQPRSEGARAPARVAAVMPPAAQAPAAQALAASSGEGECFIARKKAARKKAANHVRLVKVCQ